MLKWEGYGRKWPWPVSRYCPSIRLEGVRETTKKPVGISGIPADSWTEYLTNTDHWHCRLNQIAQSANLMWVLKEIHKHFLFTSQVNVCLECMSTNMKTLKRRFIRCSAQATITHLKKFIAKKVLNGTEKYRDVSLTFACYSWLYIYHYSVVHDHGVGFVYFLLKHFFLNFWSRWTLFAGRLYIPIFSLMCCYF
jgi:hypothetical protein